MASRVARRQAGTVRAAGFKALQADIPPLPAPPIPGTERDGLIPLACQMCGTWTAPFSGELETWIGPDGRPVQFAAGTCETCGSRQLVDPSARAVQTMTERLTAISEGRTSGDGYPVVDRRPPVLAPLGADEGTLADG